VVTEIDSDGCWTVFQNNIPYEFRRTAAAAAAKAM